MARKKNIVFRVLGIVLGVSGGFFLANIAGSLIAFKKNMEKMKQHESENNLMHSLLFGMETVGINEDTNNVFLNCQFGSMTIEMRDVPLNDDVYINISSICSRVKVSLPKGVKVIHEGNGLFGYISGEVDSCEDDIPTVHIVRNNTIATRVVVKVVDTNAEAVENVEQE